MSTLYDVIIVGSIVQDLSFATPHFPAPGESRIGTFAPGPGGKGFNQAVACHRQGVGTAFVGAVGADVLADGLKRFADGEGLPYALTTYDDVASGAASIVVNAEAQNLIVVALGANDRLSAADVAASAAWLDQAKVVLCQTECRLEATEAALRSGRTSGAVTILNTAPINELVTRPLLELADVITPNETEFAFLMSHLYDTALPERYWEASADELHGYCRGTGIGTVVITLGERGAFVSHDERLLKSGAPALMGQPEQACYLAPAQAVHAVDTTGAGDAFSGGLAAGLVKHPGDFAAAVRYASAVAGLSVTRPGTAPAMPDAAEVRALLTG